MKFGRFRCDGDTSQYRDETGCDDVGKRILKDMQIANHSHESEISGDIQEHFFGLVQIVSLLYTLKFYKHSIKF